MKPNIIIFTYPGFLILLTNDTFYTQCNQLSCNKSPYGNKCCGQYKDICVYKHQAPLLQTGAQMCHLKKVTKVSTSSLISPFDNWGQEGSLLCLPRWTRAAANLVKGTDDL